jgi:hypothetical protein
VKRITLAVVAFFVFMLAGCSTMKASAMVDQLPGVIASINTLAQASPMDDNTKAQLSGYTAWADFIVKSLGVVVKAANPTE